MRSHGADAAHEMSAPSSRPLPLDRARLRRMRLPEPDSEGDKEDRGRVLVIGGGAAVPGAIVLSGIAALRAGAGKLQLATTRDASISAGMTVPEAMVIPLPAGRKGEIAPNASGTLKDFLEHAHAILIGPGMLDERACCVPRRGVSTSTARLGRRSAGGWEGSAISRASCSTRFPPRSGA